MYEHMKVFFITPFRKLALLKVSFRMMESGAEVWTKQRIFKQVQFFTLFLSPSSMTASLLHHSSYGITIKKTYVTTHAGK